MDFPIVENNVAEKENLGGGEKEIADEGIAEESVKDSLKTTEDQSMMANKDTAAHEGVGNVINAQEDGNRSTAQANAADVADPLPSNQNCRLDNIKNTLAAKVSESELQYQLAQGSGSLDSTKHVTANETNGIERKQSNTGSCKMSKEGREKYQQLKSKHERANMRIDALASKLRQFKNVTADHENIVQACQESAGEASESIQKATQAMSSHVKDTNEFQQQVRATLTKMDDKIKAEMDKIYHQKKSNDDHVTNELRLDIASLLKEQEAERKKYENEFEDFRRKIMQCKDDAIKVSSVHQSIIENRFSSVITAHDQDGRIIEEEVTSNGHRGTKKKQKTKKGKRLRQVFGSCLSRRSSSVHENGSKPSEENKLNVSIKNLQQLQSEWVDLHKESAKQQTANLSQLQDHVDELMVSYKEEKQKLKKQHQLMKKKTALGHHHKDQEAFIVSRQAEDSLPEVENVEEPYGTTSLLKYLEDFTNKISKLYEGNNTRSFDFVKHQKNFLEHMNRGMTQYERVKTQLQSATSRLADMMNTKEIDKVIDTETEIRNTQRQERIVRAMKRSEQEKTEVEKQLTLQNEVIVGKDDEIGRLKKELVKCKDGLRELAKSKRLSEKNSSEAFLRGERSVHQNDDTKDDLVTMETQGISDEAASYFDLTKCMIPIPTRHRGIQVNLLTDANGCSNEMLAGTGKVDQESTKAVMTSSGEQVSQTEGLKGNQRGVVDTLFDCQTKSLRSEGVKNESEIRDGMDQTANLGRSKSISGSMRHQDQQADSSNDVGFDYIDVLKQKLSKAEGKLEETSQKLEENNIALEAERTLTEELKNQNTLLENKASDIECSHTKLETRYKNLRTKLKLLETKLTNEIAEWAQNEDIASIWPQDEPNNAALVNTMDSTVCVQDFLDGGEKAKKGTLYSLESKFSVLVQSRNQIKSQLEEFKDSELRKADKAEIARLSSDLLDSSRINESLELQVEQKKYANQLLQTKVDELTETVERLKSTVVVTAELSKKVDHLKSENAMLSQVVKGDKIDKSWGQLNEKNSTTTSSAQPDSADKSIKAIDVEDSAGYTSLKGPNASAGRLKGEEEEEKVRSDEVKRKVEDKGPNLFNAELDTQAEELQEELCRAQAFLDTLGAENEELLGKSKTSIEVDKYLTDLTSYELTKGPAIDEEHFLAVDDPYPEQQHFSDIELTIIEDVDSTDSMIKGEQCHQAVQKKPDERAADRQSRSVDVFSTTYSARPSFSNKPVLPGIMAKTSHSDRGTAESASSDFVENQTKNSSLHVKRLNGLTLNPYSPLPSTHPVFGDSDDEGLTSILMEQSYSISDESNAAIEKENLRLRKMTTSKSLTPFTPLSAITTGRILEDEEGTTHGKTADEKPDHGATKLLNYKRLNRMISSSNSLSPYEPLKAIQPSAPKSTNPKSGSDHGTSKDKQKASDAADTTTTSSTPFSPYVPLKAIQPSVAKSTNDTSGSVASDPETSKDQQDKSATEGLTTSSGMFSSYQPLSAIPKAQVATTEKENKDEGSKSQDRTTLTNATFDTKDCNEDNITCSSAVALSPSAAALLKPNPLLERSSKLPSSVHSRSKGDLPEPKSALSISLTERRQGRILLAPIEKEEPVRTEKAKKHKRKKDKAKIKKRLRHRAENIETLAGEFPQEQPGIKEEVIHYEAYEDDFEDEPLQEQEQEQLSNQYPHGRVYQQTRAVDEFLYQPAEAYDSFRRFQPGHQYQEQYVLRSSQPQQHQAIYDQRDLDQTWTTTDEEDLDLGQVPIANTIIASNRCTPQGVLQLASDSRGHGPAEYYQDNSGGHWMAYHRY